MSRRGLALVGAAAVVLAGWGAALVALPFTPLAIGGGIAALCAVLLLLARTTAARAVWFNVAFLVLAVGAFDAYVGEQVVPQEKQQIFGNAGDLFLPDDALGVRPKPGLSTPAKGYIRGKEIYDVTYTFDEAGLRISPPEEPGTPDDCVLFFGDSYTLGEGVDDDETMPYRTGVYAKGRFKVRNFGFFGYGPHQMLAAIESGLAQQAARCTPRYAVFQTEYHHVVRAAGIWLWDRHGPRYVLAADGRPVRNGNFDSQGDPTRVLREMEKSAVAAQIRKISMEAGAGDATEDDVKLYRAIVEESSRRLHEIWPPIEFHVVFWDTFEAQGRFPLFDAPLDGGRVVVHPISRILPPTDNPEAEYKLGDGVHPNPRTDDLIARYVAREILKVPASEAR